MTMIYVVPAPGGRVRQPERNGRIMPEEGAFVPDDDFYQRLVAAGDVTLGAPPKKAAAAPAAEAGTAPAPTTKPATEPARGSRRGSTASEG